MALYNCQFIMYWKCSYFNRFGKGTCMLNIVLINSSMIYHCQVFLHFHICVFRVPPLTTCWACTEPHITGTITTDPSLPNFFLPARVNIMVSYQVTFLQYSIVFVFIGTGIYILNYSQGLRLLEVTGGFYSHNSGTRNAVAAIPEKIYPIGILSSPA